MTTARNTISIPLKTGDLEPGFFTLAISGNDRTNDIYATCTNPGRRQNQTFLTTLSHDGVVQGYGTPVEQRDGVIITSAWANPEAGRHEIWRMTASNDGFSAICAIEMYDAATQELISFPPQGRNSPFASFAFTQDKTYVMATFDGLQIVSFEARSRTMVQNPQATVTGPEIKPALIWAPSLYDDGARVWQANRMQVMAAEQTITTLQPPAGDITRVVTNFSPPPPAQPAVIWTGQDPRRPAEIWALCDVGPRTDIIEIITCVTEPFRDALVQVPYSNYSGAISPCANPATGALQFIDPSTRAVVAVDVGSAAATVLIKSPLAAEGAAMRCDSSGRTWIVGNHPQRGPMLWGYMPG